MKRLKSYFASLPESKAEVLFAVPFMIFVLWVIWGHLIFWFNLSERYGGLDTLTAPLLIAMSFELILVMGMKMSGLTGLKLMGEVYTYLPVFGAAVLLLLPLYESAAFFGFLTQPLHVEIVLYLFCLSGSFYISPVLFGIDRIKALRSNGTPAGSRNDA